MVMYRHYKKAVKKALCPWRCGHGGLIAKPQVGAWCSLFSVSNTGQHGAWLTAGSAPTPKTL